MKTAPVKTARAEDLVYDADHYKVLTCVENSSGTTVRTSKSRIEFPRNNEIISIIGVFQCAGIE